MIFAVQPGAFPRGGVFAKVAAVAGEYGCTGSATVSGEAREDWPVLILFCADDISVSLGREDKEKLFEIVWILRDVLHGGPAKLDLKESIPSCFNFIAEVAIYNFTHTQIREKKAAGNIQRDKKGGGRRGVTVR